MGGAGENGADGEAVDPGAAALAPDAADRLVERVALAAALAGSGLLLLAIAVSAVSIVGRSLPELAGLLGLDWRPHPLPGDTEIVQLATGVAVFACLPYCQVRRGHVIVDILTRHLPLRARSTLDLVANLLVVAFAAVMTAELSVGAAERQAYGASTMVLRLPEADAYRLAALASGLLAVAALYTCWRSVREIRSGHPVAVLDGGAATEP
ncbi:MAG: TRAP transporter small permease [Hyphomicrobiaceae bacterium]